MSFQFSLWQHLHKQEWRTYGIDSVDGGDQLAHEVGDDAREVHEGALQQERPELYMQAVSMVILSSHVTVTCHLPLCQWVDHSLLLPLAPPTHGKRVFQIVNSNRFYILNSNSHLRDLTVRERSINAY